MAQNHISDPIFLSSEIIEKESLYSKYKIYIDFLLDFELIDIETAVLSLTIIRKNLGLQYVITNDYINSLDLITLKSD